MHNNGFNGGAAAAGNRVRAEDVISKIKDDGDFDRLRLKIIRKLKENEELRSTIVSLVKQSTVLSSPGAENMKPRQLSDAIHQEIGDKLMNHVSDGLWSIIRSEDGMKPEIRETVQTVYEKLSNPCGKDNGASSSHMHPPSSRNGFENSSNVTGANEIYGTPSDGEPNEPPGFGMTDVRQRTKKNPKIIKMPATHNGTVMENIKGKNLQVKDWPKTGTLDAPPGFSSVLECKFSGDASDEDPDVPPGFG